MDFDFGSFFGLTAVLMACTTIPTLLVFAALFWFIFRRWRGAQKMREASLNWPSTSGVVTRASIERRTSRTGNNATSTSYHPVIVYEYEVGGQRYRCDRLNAGSGLLHINRGADRDPQRVVDRYPVGSTVTVYYDPADPSNGALER